MDARKILKDKKRIVVKVGTSTLIHEETGALNLVKMERLVRILTDFRNSGKEIILVSSGAIGVGRKALSMKERPAKTSVIQACAAVGQSRLMMVYQKLFMEYNQIIAQILMTKYTMINDYSRENALNTFEELLSMGVIPIVNENDTVSTEELTYGQNDTLAAIVASLIGADFLLLLSDIDGLYTDDPHKNPQAKLVPYVAKIDAKLEGMGKDSDSEFGTGGMATKISSARIATESGADMVITNGADVMNIVRIMEGEEVGTFFQAHKSEDFELLDYIETKQYPKALKTLK